jgi:hypothetical protein
MNNHAFFNKFLLMITTIMLALMLAASSVPSLVPTQAFAQEEEESIEDVLEQTYTDSNKQEDIGENEGSDNSVISDPIVQTSVQPAVNVDVNVNVITDKENCEEASDNVNQRNDLSSSQVADSNGETGGEGSTYASPIVQTSTQLALNVYVDADVILAEDCIPSDNVNQRNDLSSSQVAGSNGETGGEGSTYASPIVQRQDSIARNKIVDKDIIIPISLPQ